MSDSDFELLRRWREGDAEASNQLVARHYDSVRRFFEVRLTHAAEDLTQRTFLACIESLGKQQLHTSFRSYLFGVARNQMLMSSAQWVLDGVLGQLNRLAAPVPPPTEPDAPAEAESPIELEPAAA